MFKPLPTSVDDIKALRTRDSGAMFDSKALERLAAVQRLLNNGLTVANLDPGNHLLGTKIDWGNGTSEVNIPPRGQQTIENFQFMTIWFRQIQVDPPVRLTNTASYACFYEVNKLLGNGMTQQMQIVNPWPGANGTYDLDVGQRLIVVPVGMARFVLQHDPALRCVTPPT
jgi:hypothetical protein